MQVLPYGDMNLPNDETDAKQCTFLQQQKFAKEAMVVEKLMMEFEIF